MLRLPLANGRSETVAKRVNVVGARVSMASAARSALTTVTVAVRQHCASRAVQLNDAVSVVSTMRTVPTDYSVLCLDLISVCA